MTVHTQLRVAALKCLLAADGQPMTQPILLASVQRLVPNPTITEAFQAFQSLESDGLVQTAREPVTSLLSYSLTTAGQHAAARL